MKDKDWAIMEIRANISTIKRDIHFLKGKNERWQAIEEHKKDAKRVYKEIEEVKLPKEIQMKINALYYHYEAIIGKYEEQRGE